MGVKATNEDGEVINADEAALAFAYGATGYQGALTDRSIIYTSHVNAEDRSHDIYECEQRFSPGAQLCLIL